MNAAGLTWQPVGSSCVKRISLGQPPNVLCLHLRRAFWTNQGTHVKLSGHVDFTLQLDITPYSAASRGILNSMAQQYVPSPVQASWIGTVSDQAAQDLDAQNSVKRPAAGKLHTEQQPQCDQDDVAVSVALSVEATGHVKLVLRLLTDRSSPVTGPLSSKGDMSGGMPEMQVLPSPAAKIQLKKQGLEQPAGAIPQEGSVSHSYQSPFASHQMPFSPQAKPTLALASHALSFAASSRLDGSDDEAEVQEATSAPDQSNTEVNRHSLGSNRAYSAQLHGQTLEGRQSDFDEQQHQTSTTGQRSHSGHAQPQLYKADSERCDQVENASVPHRSSGNVRHDHDVGYEVTPRHTSAVEAFLNRSKAYDLTAAVVHHGGGSSSGHYTVYRRVLCQSGEQQTNFAPGLPQWFSISDEHVQHVSVQEVLDCEATLLFYAQI